MQYGLDKTPRLVKPITCFWCGGSLRLLRNIFRGKDSSHEYCSEKCLVRGLDRELRYKATLAGKINSPWYLVLAALFTIFVLGFTIHPKARAQGHQHHDFYQHWKIPGTEKSCCNARFDQHGVERGDCEVATFELRNGEWYAYVPMLKKVIPIPDAKIIREKNPDPTGRDGHTCTSRQTGELLCAVPPTGAL